MSNDIYCSVCHAEFDLSSLKARSCPKCDTKFLPYAINETRSLTLNVGEINVLTYWASFWADHCDNLKSSLDNPTYESLHKVLKPILAKIKNQTNLKSLSFLDEVKNLEKNGLQVSYILDGKEILPPE